MITWEQIERKISTALKNSTFKRKKILMIIPDRTRTAPVGELVKIIHKIIGENKSRLDLIIALGTHPSLPWNSILEHLKLTENEYKKYYANMRCFNHEWDNQSSLIDIGTIPSEFIKEITGGLLNEKIKVSINKLIFEYDHLIILGPVFPHEIVGFSGGSKYLFPGISGPEIIDFTHWLGALITNLKIIGKAQNPVRSILDTAASFVKKPITCISFVIYNGEIADLFVGNLKESWSKAVKLSNKLHIIRKPRRYKTVFACAPEMYEDMWTGAKCMYKCEPVVADGGELIIYAPHIKSISYTHGHILEKIGYHVRDYYLKNIDKFKNIPKAVLGVSTYLKGDGSYENGVERPRINVILATGIREDLCRKIGLGYLNPDNIDISKYKDRENEGILFVEKAGETLYLSESNS